MVNSNIKSDIISAWNNKDWKRFIELCKQALDSNIELEANELYGIRLSLAFALLNEVKEKKDGCEKAIALYHELLQNEQPDTFRWAQLQKNLGFAYSERIKGDRNKNLLRSIEHYQNSLDAYKKDKDEKTWANIKANIGYAYLGLIKGEKAQNAIKASENFTEALSIFCGPEYIEERMEMLEAIKLCEDRIKAYIKE